MSLPNRKSPTSANRPTATALLSRAGKTETDRPLHSQGGMTEGDLQRSDVDPSTQLGAGDSNRKVKSRARDGTASSSSESRATIRVGDDPNDPDKLTGTMNGALASPRGDEESKSTRKKRLRAEKAEAAREQAAADPNQLRSSKESTDGELHRLKEVAPLKQLSDAELDEIMRLRMEGRAFTKAADKSAKRVRAITGEFIPKHGEETARTYSSASDSEDSNSPTPPRSGTPPLRYRGKLPPPFEWPTRVESELVQAPSVHTTIRYPDFPISPTVASLQDFLAKAKSVEAHLRRPFNRETLSDYQKSFIDTIWAVGRASNIVVCSHSWRDTEKVPITDWINTLIGFLEQSRGAGEETPVDRIRVYIEKNKLTVDMTDQIFTLNQTTALKVEMAKVGLTRASAGRQQSLD